jgi:hypothetical protein
MASDSTHDIGELDLVLRQLKPMTIAPHCLLIGAVMTSVVTACGDSTGPRPSVQISLGAETPTATIGTEPDGTPSLRCSTALVAQASGKGTAKWLDGIARFFVGPSRTVPVDSSELSAGDISSSWGADSIRSGDTQRASWVFDANIPFEVEFEIRYSSPGITAPQHASARFACGPKASGNVAPPVVNSVSAEPSATALQPGDSVIVQYDVSSTFGLWATVIDISGPFSRQRIIGESMLRHSARRVAIPVPDGAALNQRITVRVTPVDGTGQQATRTLDTQMTVADITPPTIFAAVFGDLPGNAPGARLNGQFAVGDSMWLQVAALDNNAVSWMVYEVTGPTTFRDSLPNAPPGASGYWSVQIPVRQEWTGTPTFSVYIRDAAGLMSARGSSKPDSLRIYPRVTPPMTTTTAQTAGAYALDGKRSALYLSEPSKQTVDVLSLATMTSGGSIPMPSATGGMDLSPSGDSLIVMLPAQRSFAVVDLTQDARPVHVVHLTILDSIPPLNPNFPEAPRLVTIAANGKAIIYLDERLQTEDAVIEYDLRSGAQRTRADAHQFFSPGDFHQSVGATGDRSQLFAFTGGCSQRYEVSTNAFTPCKHAFYPYVRGSAADQTGQRFIWGNVVYGPQLDSLRFYSAPFVINAVTLTPDGQRALLGGWTGITIASTADGSFLQRIPLPTQVETMLVTPDGSHAVAIQSAMPSARIYYITLP